MRRFALLLLLSALPGLAGAACWVLGPSKGEGGATLQVHRCLGICLGTLRTAPPASVRYGGLLLGVAHAAMPEGDVMRALADERCDVSGASAQLLAQTNVGTVRGLALTGLVSDIASVRGAQLSGLASRCRDLDGAQLSLALNRAEGRVRGLQVGLFNVARDLRGVQVGLLNTNAAGWTLPLLNVSW